MDQKRNPYAKDMRDVAKGVNTDPTDAKIPEYEYDEYQKDSVGAKQQKRGDR